MSSSPPISFDERAYVAWHENDFPADAPLLDRLTELRDQLITDAPTHFEQLGQLLTQTARFARVESKLRAKLLTSGYVVPTEELKGPTSTPTTFKSVASIVDKLWRKNRAGQNVTLSNIRAEITDLVRVSVVAPTMEVAPKTAEEVDAELAKSFEVKEEAGKKEEGKEGKKK